MTSLTLKELGANNPEDEPLLELFSTFREHVVHVATSELLPDLIAVTTRNGFIELIHTANGEFRLFLSHLDCIPLDASLRCFSLVPSLDITAHPRRQQHLAYSLAYSNELLLANTETGVVQVLTTCTSRPSVVHCDGDYVVCGEGTGRVTVWRGSAEATQWNASGSAAALPPLLWERPLFEDTVVCLGFHRDLLLCCAADYSCVVVRVEDGVASAAVSLDLSRAVAAFPLTRPLLNPVQRVWVVCLASRVSILAWQAPKPGSAPRWVHCGGCPVGPDEIACASVQGSYLAAGTRTGLVLLYHCDAVRQRLMERVRFNVGYGVTGLQLFPDETLVVVTTAGDVWRWPLSDLLSTAPALPEAEGVEEQDEEEPHPVTVAPPQPAAAPNTPVKAPVSVEKSAATPPPVPATPHEVSYTQEGQAEDRNLSLQEPSPARTDLEPVDLSAVRLSSPVRSLADSNTTGDAHEEESLGTEGMPTAPTTGLLPTCPQAERPSSEHSSPPLSRRSSTKAPAPSVTVAMQSTRSPPPTWEATDMGDHMASVGSASGSHVESHDGVSPLTSTDTTVHVEEVVVMEDGGMPAVELEKTAGGPTADSASPSSAAVSGGISEVPVNTLIAATAAADADPTAASSSESRGKREKEEERDSAGRRASQEMEQLEAEFDSAMGRLLGSAGAVEGLRSGRRMDPRKIAGVLTNMARQQVEGGKDGAAPRLVGINSTALLEQQKASLEAQPFNFDAYRDQHRLAVDALQYEHPIRIPAYKLNDRVYGEVDEVARIHGAATTAGTSGGMTSSPPKDAGSMGDELRDATYGRVRRVVDPVMEEEKRRGGPVLAAHGCEDLLFPSRHGVAPVLFKEDTLRPSAAWSEVLLLPMPLPPASSVF